MQERTHDMYAMQTDHQGNVGTAHYDQGRMGCGNYRGKVRGGGGAPSEGQGPLTCFRCHQQ